LIVSNAIVFEGAELADANTRGPHDGEGLLKAAWRGREARLKLKVSFGR